MHLPSIRFFAVLITAFVFIIHFPLAIHGEEMEESPEAGLRNAIAAFYAAIESEDFEARIALFSQDAMMMPNHWTIIRGKDAITATILAGRNSIFRIRDREIVDFALDGDLAYTVNSYFYTYHEQGSEAQWHKTKNVHIWRKDARDQWKLHVDIWNSDVPMQSFDLE